MERNVTPLSYFAGAIGGRTSIFAFAILAMTPTAPAFAQSLEDRLRDQLRSTMNELHAAQDQQAALQAQAAAASKERDDLKAELAAAKAQLARAGHNTVSSSALQADIAKYKDAYTQALSQASASAQQVKQAQADHDKLQTGVADTQRQLGLCEDKNKALLKVGTEILDAYQKFDLGDAIGAHEPFIGIKRVELENSVQGFDDRLHDGKFDPHAKQPTASAGGGH